MNCNRVRLSECLERLLKQFVDQLVRSKFYISDSPDNPGQRLDFIKRGLTSVDQDITNFMACYGVFARSGQGENETNWEEYALRFQRGAGWRDVMESENEMEPG